MYLRSMVRALGVFEDILGFLATLKYIEMVMEMDYLIVYYVVCPKYAR